MLLRKYNTLKAKEHTPVEINNIRELLDYIQANETLSKYGDKVQSANLFVCRKLEDWQDSPIVFSWLDIDGKNHEGVSRDAIAKAVKTLNDKKIPFLVFRTQHNNCYKIIIHVAYLSGKSVSYDEYRRVNEKFQKHIFSICKLTDYEEGSASPTKGFCMSKNTIKAFNESESPYVITFAYEPPVRQLAQNNGSFSDIQKTEKEKFEYALKFVTTDICSSFEDWTTCAMALNATFGDAGLEYFHVISSYYSDRQTPAQVDQKYRNCRNASRVSIGSVYHLIEKAGIKIDWKGLYPPTEVIQKKQVDKKKVAKKEASKVFKDVENAYYFQLHGFFSIPEMRELLEAHSVNLKGLEFSYDKSNFVVIEKNHEQISINQIFADRFDDFTKICTQKHFAIYEDVQNDKFSFNFTAEELTAWISTYPQTLFRNFEYNRTMHAIIPKVSNSEHFEISRSVISKIENLHNSELNVQDKNFKEFKPKAITALEIFEEMFETNQTAPAMKSNNGWIEDVLKLGYKYMSSHPDSDLSDYWLSSLSSIFSITIDDFESILAFTINSIRVRLYGSDQSMRAVIITGDSGIGKDSFLQGCCTGLNYRKANQYILKGSIYGATKFSAAKLKKFKSIMYNYISDDLGSANESTNLDTITNPFLGIENKGKDKIFIQKRFNSIITNNDPGVIFGKDKDHNAIARRVNFASIKYAKGCNSTDYMKFYAHYNGQFDPYWAGFFTFCFELEKFDNSVIMLNDRARQYTLDNLHRMFYVGGDDSRVMDFLQGLYENALKNINDPLIDGNEFIKMERTKEDGEVRFLIIDSLADYWRKDSKFSKDVISKAINAHVKGAKFRSSYRDRYGNVKTAAVKIPCSYFEGETSEKIDDLDLQTEKTDLITNFKKYI